MLVNVFELLGIERPSYLDVGAHHPTVISNTALLYSRGSRGVNVEANPRLYEAFRRERPLDVNLNIGVAAKAGWLDFHMFDDTSGLNSFCPEEVAALERGNMRVARVERMPVVTLDDVVNVYLGGAYPDMLLMDIEGLDYDVLAGSRIHINGPKLVCVETRLHQDKAMKAMMAGKGYRPLIRCMANLIFVRQKYYEKLA